jgi:hypothetical protein
LCGPIIKKKLGDCLKIPKEIKKLKALCENAQFVEDVKTNRVIFWLIENMYL